MIKIKFITSSPFPDGMASTNRILNYSRGLILSGADVEVYVIRSTYKGDSKNKSKGIFNGVPFCYAGSCKRSNYFIKRRIDDVLDFIKCCWGIIKDNNTNINFIYRNSFIQEFILILLSRIKKIKVVRELCEYPYYKDCFMANITLKYLFPMYDGFITISENLYILANKYKSDKAKVIKIPILINRNDMKKVTPYIHRKPYIFHGGTLTESKDAIISTMKAFAIANRTLNGSVDFILAGPPSKDLLEIKKIIKNEGLDDNVFLLGVIPHYKVMEYLAGAFVCVLNKNDTLQNRNGFSTKLSDVLLSGTAVITTTIGEACNWLKDQESAYITEPHKPELIAQEIIKAFSDYDRRNQIAQKGLDIALANFDITIQGPILFKFLHNI